jgi:hypothetical protein
LDKNGKESEVCQGLRKLYTELCPPTWVKYKEKGSGRIVD